MITRRYKINGIKEAWKSVFTLNYLVYRILDLNQQVSDRDLLDQEQQVIYLSDGPIINYGDGTNTLTLTGETGEVESAKSRLEVGLNNLQLYKVNQIIEQNVTLYIRENKKLAQLFWSLAIIEI